MSLFPMFLRLEGRRCLVVGGGEIAVGRIDRLLAAGAEVIVVAPHAKPLVDEWARDGRISWKPREFESSDLDGVLLVIAATSSKKVHEEIFQEANRRGVLCSIADEPQWCDFHSPAVIRRGDLQIAISTGGRSPALASRLRRELGQQFGPEYELWVERLGEIRRRLFARVADPGRRRRLLHRLASERALETFQRRRRDASLSADESDSNPNLRPRAAGSPR